MPPQEAMAEPPPVLRAGTPITCLSIFDSFIIQAYLDGSTRAFDLGTQQSFPLTDCEPIAFYPPIVSDHADSENADTAQPAAIQPESQGELGVGDRHITSRVNVDEISPHSRPVPVQDRLKLEEFTAMARSDFQPLLLKKETEGWAALSSWTFDRFSSGELGEVHVEVTGKAGKRFPMKLKDYVLSFAAPSGEQAKEEDKEEKEGAKERETGYLRGWTYEHHAPVLMQDFQVPGFAKDWFEKLPKKEEPMFRWIFCGPSGSRTPLHVDPCMTHAWLAQIRGRKRFVLYSPSDLRHLYDAAGACVDIRNPDRARYPTFDLAVPYEVVLSPGDVLLVPAGWAHLVECVDDSISLTHNFLPKDNFPAVRACLLANRLGKAVQQREKQQRDDDSEEGGGSENSHVDRDK